MKRLNSALLITIFTIIFAVFSGILSNAISLPSSIKDAAVPLLGICLTFMILLAVMQQVQQPKSPFSSLAFAFIQFSHVQTRSKLVQKIKKDWIEEYLTAVLFTKHVLQIEASYKPNAVTNFNRPFPISSDPISPLSLHNFFDLCRDGLLILGISGAGKTIALVELARLLLVSAANDEKQPIPLILSLSSWNTKRPPLHEWISQELQTRYGVSKSLAQFWLETDQLLLLLDDFDMVADIYRAQCIEAINNYWQQHKLIPLVICSRSVEYFSQPARLDLRHAVMLKPLSSKLVATYIAQESQRLKPIRVILNKYPQLFSYVRIPRFLDLLARFIAKQSTSVQEYKTLLQNDTAHLVEQKLLESYVQQHLQQVSASTHVTPTQIHQTLDWLAFSMKERRQMLFSLEELQPDWLPDKQYREVAQRYIRWLIVFMFMAVGEFNGFIISQSGRIPFISISFLLGQLAGRRFLRLVKDGLIRRKPTFDISLVELVSWAWKHERTRLLNQVLSIVGLCILILAGCLTLTGIIVGLWKGWAFGLLSGFLIGIFAIICLFAGASAGAIRIGLVKHHMRRPQDSMWRLARHGMLYGLLLGGGVGSIAFFITQALQLGLLSNRWFPITIGVSTGLNIWLFCSLINGGYDLLQYYVVRSLLKKAGITAMSLHAILDIAVQCRLLCLVNSSFMFPHRQLLDYFASLVRKEKKHTKA